LLLVRSLVFNIVLWLWSALLVLALVPVAPFISPPAIRRYAAFWMRGMHLALAWIVGLRFRVEGLEHLPDRPCIIASKHQSSFETLLFHTIRPDIAIGLKEELIRIPLFGWYLKIAQNIAIDRGGAAKAMRSLIKGAEVAVENGLSILIFPEGNRRPVGAPPDYKPGVAALYKALDVPVVPVALDSGRFWPRRSFVKQPGTITVRFLEPIAPGLERQAFMRLLQERTEAACAELLGDVSQKAG
jgi:1-acyl-sn-glycerol-3-phosphate acyltransferase